MWITRNNDGKLILHPFDIPFFNERTGKWSQRRGYHSCEIPNIYPNQKYTDEPIKVRLIPEESLMGLYKIIDNYKNVDSKK